MTNDKFKLPRSSYEEICKIIKAYGRLGQPSSLSEVAQLSTMSSTSISANNAFLSNVSVIEGGKAKSVTQNGEGLAIALEHELPDEIEEKWARVVNENDFLAKMGAAVKIRGKMEVSALESHIAYSAGETKSGPVMTGARAVVDMLRAAGVIREHDGQLVASEGSFSAEEATQISERPSSIQPTSTPIRQVIAPPSLGQASGASLHIELRIEAKPSELDGLGDKIQKLLLELSSPAQDDDDNAASSS